MASETSFDADSRQLSSFNIVGKEVGKQGDMQRRSSQGLTTFAHGPGWGVCKGAFSCVCGYFDDLVLEHVHELAR